MGKMVTLTQGAVAQWRPRQRPEFVVTNPPWGNRLLGSGELGGPAAARCPACPCSLP